MKTQIHCNGVFEQYDPELLNSFKDDICFSVSLSAHYAYDE